MIWGGNRRKPVFGFRLSGKGLFCKGLHLIAHAEVLDDLENFGHKLGTKQKDSLNYKLSFGNLESYIIQ